MKRVIIKFLSILSLLFIFCNFICSIQKNTCNSNGNDNLSTSLSNTKFEEKQTQKVDKKQEEENDNKKPKLRNDIILWSGTYSYGELPGWVTIAVFEDYVWSVDLAENFYSNCPSGFDYKYSGKYVLITWNSSASLDTYKFHFNVRTDNRFRIDCILTIQYATPTGFRYPSDQHRINGSSFNVSAWFSNYPYISPSNNRFTW